MKTFQIIAYLLAIAATGSALSVQYDDADIDARNIDSSGSIAVTAWGLDNCSGQSSGVRYCHPGTVLDEKMVGYGSVELKDDVSHCTRVRVQFLPREDCSGTSDKISYHEPIACVKNPFGKKGCARITCASQ